MARSNTVIMSFSIAMFLLLILLLVLTYNSKCNMNNSEKFYELTLAQQAENKRGEFGVDYNPGGGGSAPSGLTEFAPPMRTLSDRTQDGISASDPMGNSSYCTADKNNENLLMETQVAGSCIARDRLTSADLLPLDANSKWAELNPQCAGDLQDQNYLTAGYHIGINTVGQSMRNANLQLRYEPPNPQVPVSPWSISTIEPDQRGKGLLDIGAPPST